MSDKSLLAKLLATENISVQKTPGIKTAMFDLKNRVLMLPIWQGISNDLEDLLLCHETGHALDTPSAEVYKKTAEDIAARIFPGEKISSQLESTVRGFLNVIEDARIDKRQKRRYPGCRRNYLIGYKELVERDFFGTAQRDINTMNFIDRLNIYFKGGSIHSNITFAPDEKVLLKKVENAETWSDVVTVTEEVYRFCKQKLEDMSEIHIDLVDSEEGDEDGEFDIDGDGIGDADWSDESDSEDGSGEGDENGKSQGVNPGEGDIESQAGGTGRGAGPGDARPVPRSETDDAWQKKSESIVKDENSTFVYLSMPLVNYDKAVHDYKKVIQDWRDEVSGKSELQKTWGNYKINHDALAHARTTMMQWKAKERESISFMVKEFEQKKAAELYARINIAKTGVIDTNKLQSYKYNDDIFRRIATVPKGKNHGFIMFLDWSGSMQWNLKDTLKQLFSLCLFSKQIGVPFEVYAFKDSGADTPFSYLNKQNCIKGNKLVLRNFLSSRMNTEELNFAMSMLWYCGDQQYIACDGMGGTPLNNAILIAPQIVKEFTARNKLEITNVVWLTDGESNGPDGVANETTPVSTNSSRWNRKYFYVDSETGKTYDYYPHGYTGINTNTLLRILKDKTNCNLVGFYLYDGNFKRVDREFNVSNGYNDAFVKARKFWTDNKFYPVKSAGYDEYYIIDTGAMKDTVNNLVIDKTGTNKKATAKKMVAAFSKFAQKKTVNRVLLRQFVDRIATHAKKTA